MSYVWQVSNWCARNWLLALALAGPSLLSGCVENSLPANQEAATAPERVAAPPSTSTPAPSAPRRHSTTRPLRATKTSNTLLAVQKSQSKSVTRDHSKQSPKEPTRPEPRYTYRDRHDPNGIGKFYMGREIAHVMNAAAATWLERPQREQEESLSKLIPALKIRPGDVVADIGAGSGVITLMLSEKVGPNGRVVAVDIQLEMLNLLNRKVKQRKIDNVVTVLGTDKTPKLKPQTIDLAIMVDVYHEFAFPYEMLQSISQSLKPGGRVVFVEYRMEDPAVPIKLVHKMSEAQVKLEASHPEFRLKWKETIADLPWQHIIVFERLPDEKQPAPAAKK